MLDKECCHIIVFILLPGGGSDPRWFSCFFFDLIVHYFGFGTRKLQLLVVVVMKRYVNHTANDGLQT